MQEWCLAHPYMTLIIVIAIIGCIDDIFEYITGYKNEPKEIKDNEDTDKCK